MKRASVGPRVGQAARPAADEWTEEEQQRLEQGVLKAVAIVNSHEKWKAIAEVVGTRNAEDCEFRFHACRQKAKKAIVQESMENTPEGSPGASSDEAENPRDGDGAGKGWQQSNSWWNSRGGWNSWSRSKGRGSGSRGGEQGDSCDSKNWWEGQSWGGSSWNQDQWQEAGEDWQESEEKAEEEPELDENQRRALEMKKEVEANRERMRLRQERQQDEKARKEAKQAAELEELEQKRREHAEAKDKEYQDTIARKKALVEQERQREMKAKQEAERTDEPFFGSKRSPCGTKGKGGAPRGGYAAAVDRNRGAAQRQRKDEEMQRQAAEVLANLASSKTGGRSTVEDNEVKQAASSSSAAPPSAKAASEPPARQQPEPLHPSASSTAAADGEYAARSAKGQERKKKTRWWQRIDESETCPISLAPICELPCAPFALEAEGSAAPHYYDARFLASYLLSACDFIDPVNRRELRHEECVALDQHLQRHHPENADISVADAFALFKVNGLKAAGGDNQVQREATAVLQHLFRFQSARRTDRFGHAVLHSAGGLTVVDDSNIPMAPPAKAPTPERSAAPAEDGAVYPDLPGGAAGGASGAISGSWKSGSLASSVRASGRLDHLGRDGFPAPGEAFPGLPSAAKAKSTAAAKPKGPPPKAATKAKASRTGTTGARGKQHQPKAWGAPK